jgi:hypothetical protein
MLHEREQVGAAKSAFPPLADTKTGKRAGVGPSTERRLADVEEPGGFADIDEIVRFGHADLPKGVYRIVWPDPHL